MTKQASTKYFFLLITVTILLMAGTLYAQHINFSTWAGNDLTLTKGTPQDLNFNDKSLQALLDQIIFFVFTS